MAVLSNCVKTRWLPVSQPMRQSTQLRSRSACGSNSEDTELTHDDRINRGIPESVVAAIEALTKQDGLSYDENLQRVATNELAKGVKIADMLSNLADSPTNNQIRKYARGLLRLMGE